MNLGKLKEAIEDMLADGISEQAEVRLMHQPSWPFEYSISGVCKRSDFQTAVDECGELTGSLDEELEGLDGDERKQAEADELERIKRDENRKECVFLVEGRQLCYGHKEAWDAAQRY
jgi:hypothetical protein